MLETWRTSHEAHAGGVSDAWSGRRAAALAAFDAERDVPTGKTETWKYTPIRRVLKLPLVHQSSDADVSTLVDSVRIPCDAELVLVNGSLRSQSLSAGVQTLTGSEDGLGEVAPTLPFASLNDAFVQDGVHIRTAGEVLVHVICVATAEDAPVVSHPRHLVVAETGAVVTLVETHLTHGATETLTNELTEVVVHANASVKHVVVVPRAEGAHRVLTTAVKVHRDARYQHHATLLGGALIRNEIRVEMVEPGAEVHLDGVYVLGERDHVDNHTELVHSAPHCVSRELYKGVLGGRAKGIFDGAIYVAVDAQKTDAAQENRNLLLSATADANAKPRLEIYADDVKCAHGTTVGQLDRKQLAYMRSRGIPRDEAVRILTGAFVADVVTRVPVPALRERLEQLVSEQLASVWEQS